MKFKQAALQILGNANRPLKAKEIITIALESGMLRTNGRTPAQTMKAQLNNDIKKKGLSSNFIKVGRAFSLNAVKD